MKATAAFGVDAWLAQLLRASGGVEEQWTVYFEDVDSSLSGGVRENVPMDTMSVIKVPLLLLLLERAHDGDVDLGRRVRLTSDLKRMGTGILSTLDDGLEITLRDAATLMMTVSDNTATDIVFEAVGGPAQVNAALASRGLSRIEALGTAFDWFKGLAVSMDPSCESYLPGELFLKGYPIQDAKDARTARAAYHFGDGSRFGVSTAAEFGRLLRLLEAREYAPPNVCDEAMRMLGLQVSNSRIPRYLPPSTTVFHKTGDFAPFIANDVGIIRPAKGSVMIFCMFSAGHRRSWGYAEEVISRVALGCTHMVGEFTS